MRTINFTILICLIPLLTSGQPEAVGSGILFSFNAPQAERAFLAGDFNNWDPQNGPMARAEDGSWWKIMALEPGHYQYRF
ncbi:hypothetical protein KKA00_03875, partial [bacterium]|nr:hypothetical protein [bacterium]